MAFARILALTAALALLWLGPVGATLADTHPADPAVGRAEGYVAGLTDAEARKALLAELKAKGAEPAARAASDDRGGARFIMMFRESGRTIGDRLAALRKVLSEWEEPVGIAFRNLTDYEGRPAIWHALLSLIGMLVLGGTAEWFAHRRIDRPEAEIGSDGNLWSRLSQGGSTYVRRVVALLVFLIAGFAASFLFLDRYDPLREMNVAVLLAITMVRVIGATVLTMQEIAGADMALAARWRHGLQVPAAFASVGFFGSGLLSLIGLQDELLLVFDLGFGAAFVLSGVVWIVAFRDWLSRATALREGERSAVPYFASVLILIMGGAWAMTMVMGRGDRAAAAATGIALVVFVPILLYVVRVLILALFRIPPKTHHDEAKRRHAVAAGIFLVARILIVGAALIVFAEAWNVGAFEFLGSGIGRTVVGGVFKVGLAWFLGIILWEAIRQAIDRRLAEENRVDGSASRTATLLPLFRSFLLVIVIVMLGLVTMSALGIDIGPLLAGAGIVGLAIGFGAQTLVRDIVAGIFFLIDDAFRVGDYVELGRLRGTVERITLRSLQLRHHRGPVHTIPFGRVEAVTNYTRDWVIEKLELRLELGTDVDKVKKIVKKIGQELAADPEIGPNLIETLKSQGVTSLQDNSLLVKVKFMAKPREQFVIRREAYKRIIKEFNAAGIRFFRTNMMLQGGDAAMPPAASA